METWDFIFYGEEIKAKRPFTGQLRLFHAKKKSTSDLSKPPKPIKSQKRETMGLVAALDRAIKQAQANATTA
jgi:hypothetical protein